MVAVFIHYIVSFDSTCFPLCSKESFSCIEATIIYKWECVDNWQQHFLLSIFFLKIKTIFDTFRPNDLVLQHLRPTQFCIPTGVPELYISSAAAGGGPPLMLVLLFVAMLYALCLSAS